MGTIVRRPTPAQLEQMKKLVDEAMKDGALRPVEPAGQAARFIDHHRRHRRVCAKSWPNTAAFSPRTFATRARRFSKSVKEAIAIGERARIPVDIIHIKIAEQKLWGRMNEIIALIEAARKRGVNVQANVYPYTRGNNNLCQHHSALGTRRRHGEDARPAQGSDRPHRLKKEIREGLPGWYNHYTAVGGDWSRMLIAGKGSYEGLTMDRIIAAKSKGKDPDPRSARRDVRHADRGRRLDPDGLRASHGEGHEPGAGAAVVLDRLGRLGLRHRGRLRAGNPHPRNFGTFPRILGVYVRQRSLLPLEDAIRKMTSLECRQGRDSRSRLVA